MKRISFFISFLLFALCLVQGQTAKEEIVADINRSGGSYLAYTTNFTPQTQPPKGYKAIMADMVRVILQKIFIIRAS